MYMRCTIIRLLFICLVLLSFHRTAIAQCGILQQRITLTADSSNGVPVIARLSAIETQLSQHWKVNSVSWRMDGAGWTADSVFKFDAQISSGIHYLEMLLTAIDTLTGDSCTRLTGNYYITSSSDLYAAIETNGSGLTQTFTAVLYGGGNAAAPFWSFGDGNTATGMQVTHTYAQPGLYTVLFSTGTGVAGNLTRKIHAGTGVDNLTFSQAVSTAGTCDSVSLEIQTQPPYYELRYADILQTTVLAQSDLFLSPGAGVWQTFPAMINARYRISGQTLLKVEMRDANGGDYTKYMPVIIQDSCLAGNDTLAGYFWWDTDADGIKDPQEGYMDGAGARLKVFNYLHVPGEKGTYSMPIPDVKGEVIVVPFPTNTITTPDRLALSSAQSLPDFIVGVAASQVRISGKVYIDMNGDSAITPAIDRFPKGVTVKLQHKNSGKDYFSFTNDIGEYSTIIPNGYYTISVVSPLPPGTVMNPDTISQLILSASPVIPPFRISPQVLTKDLQALLLPHDRPVPGGNFRLDLIASNLGTDTCKGQFQVAYDPQLQFLSSFPPAGIHDAVNATVTWYNQTLYPVTDSVYSLFLSLPSSSIADSLINQSFLFTNPGVTDFDLSNNVYACTTKVGNFQSPFFKSVTPEGEGNPGLIQIQDRLYYRISFSNTGPGRIQHLILQDQLPATLEMSTIRMEQSSHPVDLVIRDHSLTLKYYNIGLPDTSQTSDSARVDVVFSLQPSPTSVQGTFVNNTALAFTDVSGAQISNTTTQIIQFGVGLEDPQRRDWEVFPNPFQEMIFIRSANPDVEIEEISLKDALGRLTTSEYISVGTINCMIPTHELVRGPYFLYIRSKEKNSVVKLLKW